MNLRLLFALLLAPPLAGIAAPAARPNVLMIVLDDLNDWVGHLGGHPDVRTPHLDALAARGLSFTNAHTGAPVCNPSRITVMTGRRPSSLGIYLNDTKWHEAHPGILSIPLHFKNNGYRVVGGGKVNHHMPGFNRRSDWDDYFDQVFDSPYQQQVAGGRARNDTIHSARRPSPISSSRRSNGPQSNSDGFCGGRAKARTASSPLRG
ncbi:MAG: sulfatase-like hydrolase/transferase [Opitutaceae bacterium]